MEVCLKFSGVKPKVILDDNEECKMSSHTSDLVWKIKRTGDHYTCNCYAWVYQKNTPVSVRSCKHLKELFGYQYEDARLLSSAGSKNANANSASASTSNDQADAEKTKKRARSLSVSSDEDDDVKDTSPKKKAKRSPGASAPTSSGPSNITVNVLLAQTWTEEKGCDPTGYWISEKLDGVRAFFNGQGFYSRLGNKFFAPDDFSAQWRSKLPSNATLDGELFTGRNKFQDTVSIVRSGASNRWPEVKYYVFDAPFMGNKPFEERLAFLKKIFGDSDSPTYPNVILVEHVKCTGKDHVLDKLQELQKKGAEGLMLRQPLSRYEPKRSSTLLKVKTFYDAEAKVVAHHKGSGKNAAVMGAIEVEMACGKHFRIGTGFSDAQRRKPPQIGSIVVYKFQELSKSGTPRYVSGYL
ncbi:hypothetical protein FRC16_000019 [Serendipita sp. 398]|nr:hypothetical protein FRC16_000019 [Serendipita sp. 398]